MCAIKTIGATTNNLVLFILQEGP